MDNNKLSVKEKIGYGMGDAGCNIIFGAIMLFVNYFYTDIFGLAPALVGVLLLSIRVIDAVTDPLMGALADRTQSKYGRFRPWLLWIALPYAVFSVLMFTTPDWTYNSKVIYAFITYFLLSLTYTAINIPYCSLGGCDHQRSERARCLPVVPFCDGRHRHPAALFDAAANGRMVRRCRQSQRLPDGDDRAGIHWYVHVSVLLCHRA